VGIPADGGGGRSKGRVIGLRTDVKGLGEMMIVATAHNRPPEVELG